MTFCGRLVQIRDGFIFCQEPLTIILKSPIGGVTIYNCFPHFVLLFDPFGPYLIQKPLWYSAVQCSTVQGSALQCITI